MKIRLFISLLVLSSTIGCAVPGNSGINLSSQSSSPLARQPLDSAEASPTLSPDIPLNSALSNDTEKESTPKINENHFVSTATEAKSTFSIDVDTASYTNIRRFIEQNNTKPPVDAVRIEEMVNYFPYRYAVPESSVPFSVQTQVADCPWTKGHQLIQIGIKGKPINTEQTPASNFVFLMDVSGSMGSPNKLPLLKKSFKLLVDQMREEDHVSIVVYAGAAGTVLPPTSGSNREKILDALDKLSSGGSTAGGAGIEKAYQLAKENFREKSNNRVILATDGDFNVGPSSPNELDNLIISKRNEGVFLTVLGFGQGNLQDSKMEQLADKGNGSYYYIDSELEAKKVFVTEMGGTLLTIAKDVKLQLEFDPKQVSSYRLIGYENRVLNNRDFDDDTKDAGELGAGTTVTALYEVIPMENQNLENPLAQLNLRYKAPQSDKSELINHQISASSQAWEKVNDDFRFAASVASFGMHLRGSQYVGQWSIDDVIAQANLGRGKDFEGYRAGFIKMVEKSKTVK